MPKVSINIPVYNDEKYIKETLDSALGQTYRDLEVVIVDDGSTDHTGEIIKGCGDPRIKYHYQANSGIGAARNKALELSSGEYIAFLDHDDLWLPDKLEKQLILFDKNPALGLVFCDTMFFGDHGDMYSIYAGRKPKRGDGLASLLDWYCLSCETVIIRKEAITAAGGPFPPQMMMAEEYDLFLRIASQYPIDYVDEPLAKYRIHEKNYSWGKELLAIKEEGAALENLLKLSPSAAVKFRRQINDIKNNLRLRRAILLWKEGNGREARVELFGAGITRPKTAALYLAMLFLKHETFSRYIRNPFHK